MRILASLIVLLFLQLPSFADDGGQVITTDGGGIFMEEIDAVPPPSQQTGTGGDQTGHGRGLMPYDLGNVDVPVDAEGKIIPLIEPQSQRVIPFGSTMEAYTEFVNPWGPYGLPYWHSYYRNPYWMHWNNPYWPGRYWANPNPWPYPYYPNYSPYYPSPLQRILPGKVWNKVRPWLPRRPYYGPSGPLVFNNPGAFPNGYLLNPLLSRQYNPVLPSPNIGIGGFGSGGTSFGGGLLSPFGL